MLLSDPFISMQVLQIVDQISKFPEDSGLDSAVSHSYDLHGLEFYVERLSRILSRLVASLCVRLRRIFPAFATNQIEKLAPYYAISQDLLCKFFQFCKIICY